MYSTKRIKFLISFFFLRSKSDQAMRTLTVPSSDDSFVDRDV